MSEEICQHYKSARGIGEYCIAPEGCIYDQKYQIIHDRGYGKSCTLHGIIPEEHRTSKLEEEVK